jgi:hypothetical protein
MLSEMRLIIPIIIMATPITATTPNVQAMPIKKYFSIVRIRFRWLVGGIAVGANLHKKCHSAKYLVKQNGIFFLSR